ncbi:MAG: nitrilase family protein [Bacteroidales bacterium]|jgi:predicted amidohydrolase|nr:nitrilase family protein [Bacteroidales bacterium]
MKIAIFQADTKDGKVKENITRYKSLLNNLETDTNLIILPEMFLTGFTFDVNLAQREEEGLEFMKETAHKYNTAVCGSLFIMENGQYFNRNYFVFPNSRVEYYDKKHLFSITDEVKILTAGNEKKVVAYKGWKIRLLTCYDLRFNTWSNNAVHNKIFDYDLLIYVASWADVRIKAWDALLPARAIENMAFVAGVNRCGKDKKNRTYSGHSAVFNYKGETLITAKNKKEEIAYCSLDREQLLLFRNQFPVWKDW